MAENVKKADEKRSWEFCGKKRDELAIAMVKEHEAELYRRRGGANMYGIDPTSIQASLEGAGRWMNGLMERMIRSKQVTTHGAGLVINDVVDMLEQSSKELAQKLASSQDWFVLSSEYMPFIPLEDIGWDRGSLLKLVDDPSLEYHEKLLRLKYDFGYNEKTDTVNFAGYMQIMFAKMTQEVKQCMSDRRQELEQLYDKGYSDAKGNVDYAKNSYMLNQENLARAQNIQDYFETTHNEQELAPATDSAPEMTR